MCANIFDELSGATEALHVDIAGRFVDNLSGTRRGDILRIVSATGCEPTSFTAQFVNDIFSERANIIFKVSCR